MIIVFIVFYSSFDIESNLLVEAKKNKKKGGKKEKK